MEFSRLAEIFQKLSATKKRLEITDDLASLFSESNSKEIKHVVYLITGQLLPQHYGIELGMGDKLCVRAISLVSGKNGKEVEAHYRKSGDLGDTAEALLNSKSQHTLGRSKLSTEKVYENFYKIATSGGSGSQDLKIKLLADLLGNATPLEANYIIRFVTGRLRLGAGEATVIDALSVLRAKDKSLRPELERAYNFCSDLGLVAELFFEKGIEGVTHLRAKPFSPIQPALAERLPTTEEIMEKLGECAAEGKYDGFRCISGYTPIYVLNKGIVSAKYVKKNDFVLTHKGKFKRVKWAGRRAINRKERLFRLQTFLGNEFKITEGHKVYSTSKGRVGWIPVEKLDEGSEVVFPVPDFTFIKEKPLKEIVFSDSAGYEKKIMLDKLFYRFLGYWIGDGFTNDFHNTERVGLIFNAKDKRLKEFYKRIVTERLGVRTVSENIHNGAVYLYWRDPPFKKWLSENFRHEWIGKMIPSWFANLSKEDFQEFLRGWIEADGYTDSYGRTEIVTKESDLASFAQLIALQHGIILGLKRKRIKGKTYFKLILTKNERTARIVGTRVFVKILHFEELKKIDPRTKVWNFEVEDDESYCSTMLALHNCQVHKQNDKIEIYSRRLEKMTHMFPDLVAEFKKLKPKEFIIEGEAIVFDEKRNRFLPFQATIQRKRKHGIEEKAKLLPLKFFVFDLLYLNGKDYTEKSYGERRKTIDQNFSEGKIVAPSEYILAKNAQELQEFFEHALGEGLEGIMAKDLKAQYTAGARKFAWIKLKKSYAAGLADTVDGVIVGYYLGKGKRTKFGFGGLLTAVYDEDNDRYRTVCKIGTGFSEEQMEWFEKTLSKISLKEKPVNVDALIDAGVWVEPKYVVEINADEITKSPVHTAGMHGKEGLALRFPRLVKIREDKSAKQATTEKELEELFEMQGNHL